MDETQKLAAMSFEERVAYFRERPHPNLDPRIDPEWVARSRAKAVDTILRRDAEQAGRQVS